jgi:NAD(P)-dependent dehydrogenase (short-subunit alcohol dehydrogenase family)
MSATRRAIILAVAVAAMTLTSACATDPAKLRLLTIAHTVDFSQADYQLVIDINQLGVYLGMQAVIPSMIKAGGGSIVNISSIAGMIACMGSPNLAYVGSKFAVRGMTAC